MPHGIAARLCIAHGSARMAEAKPMIRLTVFYNRTPGFQSVVFDLGPDA
jgi:hypothetical protein